jgi:outer membrane protein W
MKKKITIALCVFTMLTGLNSNAQAVSQGNALVDIYVGGPTSNMWWGSLTSETDFKTVGSPVAFGGRFEYMVADNFGVGVDVNYAITGYQYTFEDYNYNSETNTYSDAVYKYSANKLRAMLRLNYHIVQNESFDAYVGFGAGYKNAKRVYTVDGVEDGSISIPTLLPVAIRAAFGGRYYFSDNLGANFELGLGGGQILQGGLSLKF